MTLTLFEEKPKSRALIRPRDYQIEDHDEFFRLADSGVKGVLTRSATGTGKTIMACLKMDTWLQRGPDYRCMVLSYEKQLVWQFAQEVEDVLGIRPGIEMEKETVNPDRIPSIVVASRQTLMPAKPPEETQIKTLEEFGITDLGSIAKHHAKKFIRMLRKGVDPELIRDSIWNINNLPEALDGVWARLHKFDWRLNWLVVMDEAHKYSYRLKSVQYPVDWFERNPNSRRNGITATPKRFDKVSIGHKMFPGISIDFPLYSPAKRCAVKEGYAVPYVQKYISVEGVDFKSLKKVAGDFDENELERVLGEEKVLAKLVQPVLDLTGERKTLVFVPGVEMAKNVCNFINARVQCQCPECNSLVWRPRLLIDDGAECSCGCKLTHADVRKNGFEANSVDGSIPPHRRREIYDGHQGGKFQFLIVCGLCREGYNDPDISCVAILRPVSKAASSLAEQMKGRGCRPLRNLINGLETAEERLAAIRNSDKPNCLIIDLTGITGLGDCASTVQIYAEGLDDEVTKRAQQKLEESPEEMDVEDAVQQAQQEIAEERERIRKEREEAERRAREEFERRAKADAQVKYETHEVGVASADPMLATKPQYNYLHNLGFEVCGIELTKKQAGRIINQLRNGMEPDEVACSNGIKEGEWKRVKLSSAQSYFLKKAGVKCDDVRTPCQASTLIGAMKHPDDFVRRMTREICGARNNTELTTVAREIGLASRVLPNEMFQQLKDLGAKRRAQLMPTEEEFI